MLHLHLWTTPNGYKPLILLEELGVPFTLHAVDINKNVQKEPGFLALNPNGRIPALVDDDANGATVFESGAILIYLAEKYGRFLPTNNPQARANVMAWLMFQMSGIGPMFGQAYHFKGAKREDSYGLERYTKESERLLTVLESRLANHDFLADEYSIADMATLPWVRIVAGLGLTLDALPGTARWVQRCEARPAVARALAWKP
jgi:GSH-dependent disulfide-bond oxidoreductase